MFSSYIKIAIRNLWKHRVFSAINVLSLAVGISASLVIGMIVYYEYSFDTFHPDKDRIYRVVTKFSQEGDVLVNSGVAVPLGPAVQRELSGVETTAHFLLYEHRNDVSIPLAKGQTVYKQQSGVIFADNRYFNIFHYHWLAGNPQVLAQPNVLVLTEGKARIYFPGTPLMDIPGRTVVYNDSVRVTVAGIVKEPDGRTDLAFSDFISLSTIPASAGLSKYMRWDNWNHTSSISQLFIKLKSGVDPEKITAQLASLNAKYIVNDPVAYKATFLLQPLRKLHFSDYASNPYAGHQAHKPTLLGLMIVAVLLLLLGAVNFINLQTAGAGSRSREIGIRKVMGSSRQRLIGQFLAESAVLTFLAILLSIALTPLILELFARYIPNGVTTALLWEGPVVCLLLILLLLVSFLSGFYPALVLSGFQPVKVLKDQAHHAGSSKAWLRRTLTVAQFALSLIFIMGTLIVGEQIRYSLNKEMGFRKEAVINIMLPRETDQAKHAAVLLDKMRAMPEVEMVSQGQWAPAAGGSSVQTMTMHQGNKQVHIDTEIRFGDTNYLPLFRLQLLAGRNLLPSDTMREYIVNEAFTRAAGFKQPQDAVGKVIDHFEVGMKVPITGVVKDFHFRSLHNRIGPLAISSMKDRYQSLYIALKRNNNNGEVWNRAFGKLEQAWKAVYPERPFEYTFIDKSIADFYSKEQATRGLLQWATGLAIFISCLGLLGLSIYATHQRTKEIGIRKVLGAGVMSIVTLLSKDFIGLVCLAIIIASPLAWYAMHRWLQNFAYAVNISWWVFVMAGLGAILAALLTVSVQTVRAALVNPAKILRTE